MIKCITYTALRTARAKALLCAVSLVVLALTGVGARTLLPSTPTSAAPPLEAQRARPISRLETEVVTVTSAGMQPASITRPNGAFLLMVEDLTGGGLNLHLGRETGEALHDMALPRGQMSRAERLDLPPGRYLLTDTNHPEHSCRILIDAN